MSDLLEIGSQCSHLSCNELDFLPIVCRCNKYYCRHHIAPDIHECPVDPAVNNSGIPFEKLQRCAVEGCRKPSLNAFNVNPNNPEPSSATCSSCQKSFCVDHRHPKSHSCPQQQAPVSRKSEAARALLAKNFPAHQPTKKATSRRPAKIPTDPIKLAQYRKVELMKMRHQAIPGDPKDRSTTISPDQRIHVKLEVDGTTQKVFWFRKTMVTGKVLDLLVPQVRMTSTDTCPLQIVTVTSDSNVRVLRNDQLLADEVGEGDVLVIRRII